MKRRSLARVDKSNPEKTTLIFNSTKAFMCDLNDFKDGERIWVELSTYYKTRSLAQNALLHAYLQEIADCTGNEMEDIKEVLKMKFLTFPVLDKNGNEQFNPSTGDLMVYVKDTRKLTTVEMATFCEQVRMWALEWGIILVNPNEQSELRFKTT